VLDTVVDVSSGCADVFDADDQGLARITTNAVPESEACPTCSRSGAPDFKCSPFQSRGIAPPRESVFIGGYPTRSRTKSRPTFVSNPTISSRGCGP
jgi:hypothetical protein